MAQMQTLYRQTISLYIKNVYYIILRNMTSPEDSEIKTVFFFSSGSVQNISLVYIVTVK